MPTTPASSLQQLAGRPLRRPDVVFTPTEAGGRLRVPLEPRRLAGWLLRMRGGEAKTFELDALGTFVWQQADGQSSVRRIARRLSQRFRVHDRDAHVATLAFLKTLADKGLMAVLPPAPRERGLRLNTSARRD